MICKVIRNEKNEVLCENIKNGKREWISKHHFYPRDLFSIKEDRVLKIKKGVCQNLDGMKSGFVKVELVNNVH